MEEEPQEQDETKSSLWQDKAKTKLQAVRAISMRFSATDESVQESGLITADVENVDLSRSAVTDATVSVYRLQNQARCGMTQLDS